VLGMKRRQRSDGVWGSNGQARTENGNSYADWFEVELAKLPGWEELPERERQFILAYACTGSKAEVGRFVSRSEARCHDRRFRTKAFMEMTTPGVNEAMSFILSIRGRLLAEAPACVEAKALLKLEDILDAERGRRSGVTSATQFKAIKILHKITGLVG